MAKICFTISSQTIPYVEMKLSGKNRVMIPVGRMLNVMEEMLSKQVKIITVGSIDVFSVYNSSEQRLFVEQRSDNCIENNIARFNASYNLKRYIELYSSIIDLVRYANCYYHNLKVFDITLNKTTDITIQSILDGTAEIYVARSVNHVYKQFNEVHPYLLDNADQCNTRILTEEEIKDLCTAKADKFMHSLYESNR